MGDDLGCSYTFGAILSYFRQLLGIRAQGTKKLEIWGRRWNFCRTVMPNQSIVQRFAKGRAPTLILVLHVVAQDYSADQ